MAISFVSLAVFKYLCLSNGLCLFLYLFLCREEAHLFMEAELELKKVKKIDV